MRRGETRNNLSKRNQEIDALKGILIIAVVFGHYSEGLMHDFIFLWHMPLFFVVSGCLLKDGWSTPAKLLFRAKTLLIPYCVYLMLDLFFVRKNYTVQMLERLVYGGRALTGVYWYTTCFLAAVSLLAFLTTRFSPKVCKLIILGCGCAALIESNLVPLYPWLSFPGVPWCLDVALLAVVYLSVGFYGKEAIRRMLSGGRWYNIVSFLTLIGLTFFCIWNYHGGVTRCYLDMKVLYYRDIASVVIIPAAFSCVLLRGVYWLGRLRVLRKLYSGLAVIGRMTVPVMFLHVPLNYYQDQFGYGLLVYVLIGLGIPILFTLVFHRYKIMRVLFGLPKSIALNE